MKKTMMLFMSTVLTLAFLVGMQTVVFATTADVSEESRLEESSMEETVQPRNEVSGEAVPEINPISENNEVPNTGVVNLAIPGMAALLAAGTAAAALIGKKK